MSHLMTKDSPCVLTMIKDVRTVYESMQDGSGVGENINIYFLASDQKFVVSQDAVWSEPTGDGGYVENSDTMWEQSYSWNEMTAWYFSNRLFSYDEFLLQNEKALKAAYVNSNEIMTEDSSIESFSNFVFHNAWYAEQLGETVGLCHGDLGHRLF